MCSIEDTEDEDERGKKLPMPTCMRSRQDSQSAWNTNRRCPLVVQRQDQSGSCLPSARRQKRRPPTSSSILTLINYTMHWLDHVRGATASDRRTVEWVNHHTTFRLRRLLSNNRLSVGDSLRHNCLKLIRDRILRLLQQRHSSCSFGSVSANKRHTAPRHICQNCPSQGACILSLCIFAY
jgi:hypothetical protein